MVSQIAVLLHHDDESWTCTNYFMKLIVHEWERMGIRVEILRGIDRHVTADVVVPHLDFTITPRAYQQFLDQYPLVINRRLNDISKRYVSRQLLTRDSDYAGQVIVKTNFNACGHSEKVANSLRELIKKGVPKMLRKPIKQQVPWRFRKSLDGYPVFNRLQDVPRGVFANPHLVVERFLPEREGDLYVLRNWIFLNGLGSSTKLRAKVPVVKAANSFNFEEIPVPEELRALRRDLGVDFGKLDYVIHEGRVVLYDVNKTPTLYGDVVSPRARARAAVMAQGLFSFTGE